MDGDDEPPAPPANATWMTIRLPTQVLSSLKKSTPPQPITFSYTGQSNSNHVLTLGKDQYIVNSQSQPPDGNEIFRKFDASDDNSPAWFIQVGKVYQKLTVQPKPNADAAKKVKAKAAEAAAVALKKKQEAQKPLSTNTSKSSSAVATAAHSSSSEEDGSSELFKPIRTEQEHEEACTEFKAKYSQYLDVDLKIQETVRQFEAFGERLRRCSPEDEELLVRQIRESYEKTKPHLSKLMDKFEEMHKELTMLRKRIEAFNSKS
eukprot:TRINITY_DN3950_c0_g1_i4.p1 TRINITY_DN3950_c0_g1~~TRINITY_DN3950_c0_g1_i4.p1  ORF type:complete len:284 (-),score=63.91 TRINITY_DN3950_c0_g1_i4:30-815(-)